MAKTTLKKMNVLDKIVALKTEEVESCKKRVPLSSLVTSPGYSSKVPSLKSEITREGSNGIIAEFKRASPSKGAINKMATVESIVTGYEKAGVAGVSILTDREFFGGCNDDLQRARALVSLPIIRKEFIIDPYQVHEAKAIGASAILLIGAILDKTRTMELAALANSLGLEVLFEIHGEEELTQLNPFIQMVGINNRDLKTFKVDTGLSIKLAGMIPDGLVPVAESGIASPDDYKILKAAGFKGFLIGELFMKHDNPAQACLSFCEELRAGDLA